MVGSRYGGVQCLHGKAEAARQRPSLLDSFSIRLSSRLAYDLHTGTVAPVKRRHRECRMTIIQTRGDRPDGLGGRSAKDISERPRDPEI